MPHTCVLGPRPIDLHIAALTQLGGQVSLTDTEIVCFGKLTGTTIWFPYPSVGATENVILAAVMATGHTRIFGAAKEPEVETLCHYLVKCGAKISGIGTERLEIDGVDVLNGCEMRIPADRIA